MSQTLEAVVTEKGHIRLIEPIDLKGTRRALVTLLPNEPVDETLAGSLSGLGEILDKDLESASKEISASILNALDHSSDKLAN